MADDAANDSRIYLVGDAADSPPQRRNLSGRRVYDGGDGRKFGGGNVASREAGRAMIVAAMSVIVKTVTAREMLMMCKR